MLEAILKGTPKNWKNAENINIFCHCFLELALFAMPKFGMTCTYQGGCVYLSYSFQTIEFSKDFIHDHLPKFHEF